jgi:hypothetical protein
MRVGDESSYPATPGGGPSPQRRPAARPPGAATPSPAASAPLAKFAGELPRLPRRRSTTLSDPLIETPLDYYAIESLLNEHAFNGSRPDERLGTLFMPSELRGDCPYWDLDEAAISRTQGALTVYGQANIGPFRAGSGKTRIRLHYAERPDRDRMIGAFGAPHGHEPAFMRSSYRTLLVKTHTGWQQLKFSLPERTIVTSPLSNKALLPDNIEVAVRNSRALGRYHAYAPEPAGLVLDLGDGGRPITQLWRTLPVAERGFQPGDSVFVLHALTDPMFAASDKGQRLFAQYAGGQDAPLRAQQAYLRVEVAPKLADLVWLSLTETHAYPLLHEQNIDVITDGNGRVVDLIAKDLHDIALDRRGMQAARHLDRWPDFDEALAIDESAAVADHHQRFLGQVGSGFETTPEHEGNFLLDAVGEHLLAKTRRHVRPEWLESQRGSQAYEASFGSAAAGPIGSLVAGVRDLLIRANEGGQLRR